MKAAYMTEPHSQPIINALLAFNTFVPVSRPRSSHHALRDFLAVCPDIQVPFQPRSLWLKMPSDKDFETLTVTRFEIGNCIQLDVAFNELPGFLFKCPLDWATVESGLNLITPRDVWGGEQSWICGFKRQWCERHHGQLKLFDFDRLSIGNRLTLEVRASCPPSHAVLLGTRLATL